MSITVILAAAALLLALGSWCVFIWAAREGQFTDIEDIKHRVLENELRAGEGDPALREKKEEEKKGGGKKTPLPELRDRGKNHKIPVWLLVLYGSAAVWFVIYLARHLY